MEDQRQTLQARLIAKAWKDEKFRQELLRNPNAAVEREFGMKLPPGIQIQVHEETSNTLHLVLPSNADAPAEAELTDADLEAVAGGGATWEETCGATACNPDTCSGCDYGGV
jgi:hypothetical protein